MSDDRPVLFVTNHAPPYRVGAFAALHEREDVVFALVGGGMRHGGGADARRRAAVPGAHGRRARRRARSPPAGRYRAVIAGISGRVALPAAYAAPAARACRSCCGRRSGPTRAPPAHALSYLPLRHIYRARRRGRHLRPARQRLRRAPGRARPGLRGAAGGRRRVLVGARRRPDRRAPFQAAVRGPRGAGEGRRSAARPGAPRPSSAAGALVLVGEDGPSPVARATGAVRSAPAAGEVRNFYAGSDVVVVPSIPTRDFLEPWGLVVNEAMHQGVPVIATDAVGAAAGGLVRHERNGLVVPPATPARSPPRCAACTTTRAARAPRRRRARGRPPPTPTRPGPTGMSGAAAAGRRSDTSEGPLA